MRGNSPPRRRNRNPTNHRSVRNCKHRRNAHATGGYWEKRFRFRGSAAVAVHPEISAGDGDAQPNAGEDFNPENGSNDAFFPFLRGSLWYMTQFCQRVGGWCQLFNHSSLWSFGLLHIQIRLSPLPPPVFTRDQAAPACRVPPVT